MKAENNWLVKYNIHGLYNETVIKDVELDEIEGCIRTFHHAHENADLFIISAERYIYKHRNNEI